MSANSGSVSRMASVRSSVPLKKLKMTWSRTRHVRTVTTVTRRRSVLRLRRTSSTRRSDDAEACVFHLLALAQRARAHELENALELRRKGEAAERPIGAVQLGRRVARPVRTEQTPSLQVLAQRAAELGRLEGIGLLELAVALGMGAVPAHAVRRWQLGEGLALGVSPSRAPPDELRPLATAGRVFSVVDLVAFDLLVVRGPCGVLRSDLICVQAPRPAPRRRVEPALPALLRLEAAVLDDRRRQVEERLAVVADGAVRVGARPVRSLLDVEHRDRAAIHRQHRMDQRTARELRHGDKSLHRHVGHRVEPRIRWVRAQSGQRADELAELLYEGLLEDAVLLELARLLGLVARDDRLGVIDGGIDLDGAHDGQRGDALSLLRETVGEHGTLLARQIVLGARVAPRGIDVASPPPRLPSDLGVRPQRDRAAVRRIHLGDRSPEELDLGCLVLGITIRDEVRHVASAVAIRRSRDGDEPLRRVTQERERYRPPREGVLEQMGLVADDDVVDALRVALASRKVLLDDAPEDLALVVGLLLEQLRLHALQVCVAVPDRELLEELLRVLVSVVKHACFVQQLDGRMREERGPLARVELADVHHMPEQLVSRNEYVRTRRRRPNETFSSGWAAATHDDARAFVPAAVPVPDVLVPLVEHAVVRGDDERELEGLLVLRLRDAHGSAQLAAREALDGFAETHLVGEDGRPCRAFGRIGAILVDERSRLERLADARLDDPNGPGLRHARDEPRALELVRQKLPVEVAHPQHGREEPVLLRLRRVGRVGAAEPVVVRRVRRPRRPRHVVGVVVFAIRARRRGRR
mmetsp:Transcript_25015/g.99440  ORF Transcript_25015/g.99440 Transcript_25015/m.99440 type:complete len:813 (-) Transcript_25015:333-2771(-)